MVWAPACQAIPVELQTDLEARSLVRLRCRRSKLAKGRLDADHDIGEIQLTWYVRLVAILVTDRPVGVGSLQAARRGI